MFGIAGILGPKYMGTTNYGLSSAFLFSSFLSCLCLLSVGTDVLTDTIMYFSIVVAILLAVIVTIPIFMKSAYIKYFLQRVKVRKIDVEAGPEEQQQSMMNSEVQLPTKLTP
jgi:hypothetical protein